MPYPFFLSKKMFFPNCSIKILFNDCADKQYLLQKAND